MELGCTTTKDNTWWVFTLPAFFGSQNLLQFHVLFSLFVVLMSLALFTWDFATGGFAWRHGRNRRGSIPIPGPKGLPFLGSLLTLGRRGALPHRSLAAAAWNRKNTQLMAFSLGSTPVVVSSDPQTAREILTSPHFADRPIKQSARSLMFSRAIGFAPNGTYWRHLRRIASSNLFSPRRILAHEPGRQLDCAAMLEHVSNEQQLKGSVSLRKHLQFAALNNIMSSVFGKRYGSTRDSGRLETLQNMVREGFELLGSFNWSDHLPWLSQFYDPFRVQQRCSLLVPRVQEFVRAIIEEHRLSGGESRKMSDNGDFVDVLLSLDGEEKIQDDDMIAILWEMIFRGTDTTALLTEWIMAELVLNQKVQDRLYAELEAAVGNRSLSDADVAKLPYLQSVVKESLRVHPPGPLLSWARLSTSDVSLTNGMLVPAYTTAMVNMWAITHDPNVWEDPLMFKPERFISSGGGVDVDLRGNDLRLAPFGAGRRVCPGKNLGLATVTFWVAQLVRSFKWIQDETSPVDLSELLKLSCEMKYPLCAVAVQRNEKLGF
ncbi:hypothetical protein Q3G72_026056 [Acer saccharum]|nr:hypothetical protein Q3G72_026056 [Acer saccharum]